MAFLSFTRCRPAEEPQVAADFQPREVVAKMTQCDTVVLSFTEGRMGRIEGLHRDVLIFTCQNPEKRTNLILFRWNYIDTGQVVVLCVFAFLSNESGFETIVSLQQNV